MKERKIFGVKVEHGVIKRGVIIFWSVAVSLALYIMSLPLNMKNSSLVMNYFIFAMIMFGGGLAYHRVTLMIECPQTEENYDAWLDLVRVLIKAYMGFCFSAMCIGFGVALKGVIGFLLAVVGGFAGIMWVFNRMVDSHKYIAALIDSSAEK